MEEVYRARDSKLRRDVIRRTSTAVASSNLPLRRFLRVLHERHDFTFQSDPAGSSSPAELNLSGY